MLTHYRLPTLKHNLLCRILPEIYNSKSYLLPVLLILLTFSLPKRVGLIYRLCNNSVFRDRIPVLKNKNISFCISPIPLPSFTITKKR